MYSDSHNVGLSNDNAIEEDPPDPVAVCVENPAYSRPHGDCNEAGLAPKTVVSEALPELLQENQSDDDTDFNIYGNEGPLELPIKVRDLASLVRDMKNRPNTFKDEYQVKIIQANIPIHLINFDLL